VEKTWNKLPSSGIFLAISNLSNVVTRLNKTAEFFFCFVSRISSLCKATTEVRGFVFVDSVELLKFSIPVWQRQFVSVK
jgi:hypothetical protein